MSKRFSLLVNFNIVEATQGKSENQALGKIVAYASLIFRGYEILKKNEKQS